MGTNRAGGGSSAGRGRAGWGWQPGRGEPRQEFIRRTPGRCAVHSGRPL